VQPETKFFDPEQI
jgi:hypothetical protein